MSAGSTGRLLKRRIAQQHFQSELRCDARNLFSDVAVTDDADGLSFERQPAMNAQMQQRGSEIFRHGSGVAPGRGRETNSGVAQVLLIHVVHADGRCAYEAHRRSVKQSGIDLGDGADEQGVRLLQVGLF